LTQGIPFDDYIAVAAFAYFGLKTLYDSYQLGEFYSGFLQNTLNVNLLIYLQLIRFIYASYLEEGDNSGIEEEQEEAEEVVEKVNNGLLVQQSIKLRLTFSGTL
jgi:hypothetical protein